MGKIFTLSVVVAFWMSSASVGQDKGKKGDPLAAVLASSQSLANHHFAVMTSAEKAKGTGNEFQYKNIYDEHLRIMKEAAGRKVAWQAKIVGIDERGKILISFPSVSAADNRRKYLIGLKYDMAATDINPNSIRIGQPVVIRGTIANATIPFSVMSLILELKDAELSLK